MSAFLPHHDPDPDARAADLEQIRSEYQYNYTYVSPLAMVDQVPLRDEFSWKWLVQCGEHSLKMLANHIEVDGDLKSNGGRTPSSNRRAFHRVSISEIVG